MYLLTTSVRISKNFTLAKKNHILEVLFFYYSKKDVASVILRRFFLHGIKQILSSFRTSSLNIRRTNNASRENSWETAGEQLGNSWETAGEPGKQLGNSWEIKQLIGGRRAEKDDLLPRIW
jgi:hypothetical protein